MNRQQKRIFFILLAISVAVFLIYILPNSKASENVAMVQMFQPDEATPLPYLFHMIAPAENLNQALRSFVFYEYYYYGFPFFALSALVLIPLQWLGLTNNITLVMLILRQLVSVLPMLAALLLLTYLQDEFRTYRSIVLYCLLLIIPAVVQNALWWHPDGITFLFVVLTLFFLKKDDLKFRRNFIFAAISTGFAAAIKLVGFYFFLAIALYLVLGVISKRVSWKRLVLMAGAFVGVMAISFLIANPFLLFHWARTEYLNIFNKQVFMLAEGYGVIYDKGLLPALPDMEKYFGGLLVMIISLVSAVWGAIKSRQRLLHSLILAWFVPITSVIFFATHFKYQYWLPVALPVVSCIIFLLPEKMDLNLNRAKTTPIKAVSSWIPLVLMVIVLGRAALFIPQDYDLIRENVIKSVNNPRIEFFDQAKTSLEPLPQDKYSVYFDYRLYVPETPGWSAQTTYDLLKYDYINNQKFDILFLLEQRIRDYLNPEVTGIDPAEFALNQQFYRDAENGNITGYHLIYRNNTGLVYISEEVYEQYFHK